MPLPNNALVLVTDGRKTLFLRNEGDIFQIDLRTETLEQRDEASFNHDIAADGPGANFQSAGYGHSTYEETDYKQLDEDKWARSAAEEVNRRSLANDFDELVIIAPPRTLGELRKKLRKDMVQKIRAEIPKEMTGHPVADIEKLVEEATKPDIPAA